MQLVDEQNAESYLRATGRIAPGEEVAVRELSGGVSNIVLLVSHAAGEPWFVVKQARDQLRVPDPWFSDVARVWREVDVLEISGRILSGNRAPGSLGSGDEDQPAASQSSHRPRSLAHFPRFPADSSAWSVNVPRLLFVDRENYLFAMTAAPGQRTWKQLLLDGKCDATIAGACGRLLGLLHAQTWNQSDVAARIADRRYFEQLRVDPYYRHVARRQPARANAFVRLIESLESNPRCLVHGDFSPKNILVADCGLTILDFEVGHFGDPAFDIGFFLSHLVLKAFHFQPRRREYTELTFAFWEEYERQLRDVAGEGEFQALIERGIGNLVGCLLARVDGKSKVEYLDPAVCNRVRDVAGMLIDAPPATWSEMMARLS